jgi:glycosyltransferase involved in cell wall biosynthesis
LSAHDDSEQNVTSAPPDILVVAPWLQGGGGQGALAGVLRDIPRKRIRLLVLFDENRDIESVTSLVAEAVFLQFPRNPVGVYRASRALAKYVRQSTNVYSLMRASHLVMGLLPSPLLKQKRFAATFHQLPSHDSIGFAGKIEDLLVRRATRRADLVTAPSQRAVEELINGSFAAPAVVKYEANHIVVNPIAERLHHQDALDGVKMLIAGRLSEQKGIDRIPALLAQLNVPVKLRIAGSGEFADIVASWQHDESVRADIDYVGYVSELTPHLDWCDAVLMPSRWELNPLVVWEAWARGKPVIASRLPVFEDLSQAGPLLLFATSDELRERIENDLVPAAARNCHAQAALAANARQASEGKHLARFLKGQ